LSLLNLRDVRRFGSRTERYFGGHALGVLPAQVPINLQGQHSAVTVAKPSGNRRNINPALNASRRKQVAQGMVCESGAAHNFASSGECALAFGHVAKSKLLANGLFSCGYRRRPRRLGAAQFFTALLFFMKYPSATGAYLDTVLGRAGALRLPRRRAKRQATERSATKRPSFRPR